MAVVSTTLHIDGTRTVDLRGEPQATVDAIETAYLLGVPISFEGFGAPAQAIVSYTINQHAIDATTYGSVGTTWLPSGQFDIHVVLK